MYDSHLHINKKATAKACFSYIIKSAKAGNSSIALTTSKKCFSKCNVDEVILQSSFMLILLDNTNTVNIVSTVLNQYIALFFDFGNKIEP